MPCREGFSHSDPHCGASQRNPARYVMYDISNQPVYLHQYAAPFKVNVQGYTIEDEEMLCLNIEIDFRKGRFFW